jgi:hypothetical protein
MEIDREKYLELVRAVILYQWINNNNRAGIHVFACDWAQAHHEGVAALAGVDDDIHEEALHVLDEDF